MIDAAGLVQMAKVAETVDVYPDQRFPPAVYYRFLGLLTYNIKPRCSVELGVCGGGASLHMALGYPEGVVIGIDKDRHYLENISYVREVCSNFVFWQADSIAAAEFFYDKFPWYGPVDVLFLDTVHTHVCVMAEFEAWEKLLAPGAVVVVDDLLENDTIEAWDELPGCKVRLDFLHSTWGFGVILL